MDRGSRGCGVGTPGSRLSVARQPDGRGAARRDVAPTFRPDGGRRRGNPSRSSSSDAPSSRRSTGSCGRRPSLPTYPCGPPTRWARRRTRVGPTPRLSRRGGQTRRRDANASGTSRRTSTARPWSSRTSSSRCRATTGRSNEMRTRCIDCGRPYPVDDALWHPDPNGRCYDRTQRRPTSLRGRLLGGVGSAVMLPLIWRFCS